MILLCLITMKGRCASPSTAQVQAIANGAAASAQAAAEAYADAAIAAIPAASGITVAASTNILAVTNGSNVTLSLSNAPVISGANITAIPESAVTSLTTDLGLKQQGSVNLTNWSALSTNALTSSSSGQTGSANLTNWSSLSTNVLTGKLVSSSNLLDVASVSASRTNLGANDAANLTTGTLPAGRAPAYTGDITTSAGALATTLATVNGNVGSFGSATAASVLTVNAKGLVTAASSSTVTPAVSSITGLGTGVATWLATPSSANLNTLLITKDGSYWTNLPPTALVSNGTFLVNGILATNSGATTGAFLTEVGANRAYSYNAGSLTNFYGLANAKYYGAVGDGVTDDSAAFITLLSVGGNDVFAPAANYLINTNLFLKPNQTLTFGPGLVNLGTNKRIVINSGSRLIGAGISNTVFRVFNTNGAAIASTSAVAYVELKGFSLYGMDLGSTGIVMDAWTYTKVKDVMIDRFRNATDTGLGLQMRATSAGNSHDNEFYGLVIANSDTALVMDATDASFICGYNRFNGLHIDQEVNCVWLLKSTANGAAYNEFYGTFIQGAATSASAVALKIEGSVNKFYGLTMDNVTSTNLWFSGAAASGNYIKGVGFNTTTLYRNDQSSGAANTVDGGSRFTFAPARPFVMTGEGGTIDWDPSDGVEEHWSNPLVTRAWTWRQASNATPALVLSSASGTVATFNQDKSVTFSGVLSGNGSGLTGFSVGLTTNQFTTNIAGTAIVGNVIIGSNLTVNVGTINATVAQTAGLTISNQTAATAALAQNSAGINLTSAAWSTNGGVSVPVQWTIYDVPANVVNVPTDTLHFGRAVSNSSASDAMTLTGAGALITGAAITSGGSVTINASQDLLWTGRSHLQSSANGFIELYNSAQTDFTGLRFGGTTAAFPALRRANGNLEVTDGANTGTTNNFIVPGIMRATNGVISKAQYNSTAASVFNWTSNNLYAGKITVNAGTAYLTNAVVTTNSVVLATLNSTDITASTLRAVPTVGLITFSFLAAPTSTVDISWKIESP